MKCISLKDHTEVGRIIIVLLDYFKVNLTCDHYLDQQHYQFILLTFC